MTALVVDQAVACGSCPPQANCLPASHGMQHLGVGGWKYLGCRVHRACQEYTPTPAEPADTMPAAIPAETADAEPAATDGRGQHPQQPGRLPPGGGGDRQADPTPPRPGTDDAGTGEAGRAAGADQPGAHERRREVGQLLASHRTWWCPYCLNGRALNRPCCKTPLLRARVTIRRDDHDAEAEITADDYAQWFPERDDDGQPREEAP